MNAGDELQEIYRQERKNWSQLFGRVLQRIAEQFPNLADAENVRIEVEEARPETANA
jgi:hypothetical protein